MYIRPWPTFCSICNVIVSVQNSGKVASSQAGPSSQLAMLWRSTLTEPGPASGDCGHWSQEHHVITNLSLASAERSEASSHSQLIWLYGTSVQSSLYPAFELNVNQLMTLRKVNWMSITLGRSIADLNRMEPRNWDPSSRILAWRSRLWRFTEIENTG